MPRIQSAMPPRSKKPPPLTDTAVETLEPPAVDTLLSAPVVEVAHRRKKHKVSRRASDLVSAVPTAVFRRLVRELTQDVKSDMRWEAAALEALQVDAEAYMIERFGSANTKKEMCDCRTLKKVHFVVN
jgi:histone H3/H4